MAVMILINVIKMVSSSLVLDPELINIKTDWDLLSLHLKMCVSLFIISEFYCRLTKKKKQKL